MEAMFRRTIPEEARYGSTFVFRQVRGPSLPQAPFNKCKTPDRTTLYQIIWVENYRQKQPTNCPFNLTGLQQRVQGNHRGPARAQQPLIHPPYSGGL